MLIQGPIPSITLVTGNYQIESGRDCRLVVAARRQKVRQYQGWAHIPECSWLRLDICNFPDPSKIDLLIKQGSDTYFVFLIGVDILYCT